MVLIDTLSTQLFFSFFFAAKRYRINFVFDAFFNSLLLHEMNIAQIIGTNRQHEYTNTNI